MSAVSRDQSDFVEQLQELRDAVHDGGDDAGGVDVVPSVSVHGEEENLWAGGNERCEAGGCAGIGVSAAVAEEVSPPYRHHWVWRDFRGASAGVCTCGAECRRVVRLCTGAR